MLTILEIKSLFMNNTKLIIYIGRSKIKDQKIKEQIRSKQQTTKIEYKNGKTTLRNFLEINQISLITILHLYSQSYKTYKPACFR